MTEEMTMYRPRALPAPPCRLTSEGLHQDHGHGCHAGIEVSAYPGEVMIVQSDTILGTVGVCLTPEDARHYVERLVLAIDLAVSLGTESAEPATFRLNADGDRMPIRPAPVEHHAV